MAIFTPRIRKGSFTLPKVTFIYRLLAEEAGTVAKTTNVPSVNLLAIDRSLAQTFYSLHLALVTIVGDVLRIRPRSNVVILVGVVCR